MKESIKNRNVSYEMIKPKLGMRQNTVYNLISNYKGLTAHEVAEKMVLPLHVVAGRVTELADMFMVKSTGTKMNKKTGKPNTIWAVNTKDERERNVLAHVMYLKGREHNLKFDREMCMYHEAKDLINHELNKIRKEWYVLAKMYNIQEK